MTSAQTNVNTPVEEAPEITPRKPTTDLNLNHFQKVLVANMVKKKSSGKSPRQKKKLDSPRKSKESAKKKESPKKLRSPHSPLSPHSPHSPRRSDVKSS